MFKSPEQLRQRIAQSLSTIALKMIPITDLTALSEALVTRPNGGYETQVRLAIPAPQESRAERATRIFRV